MYRYGRDVHLLLVQEDFMTNIISMEVVSFIWILLTFGIRIMHFQGIQSNYNTNALH